MVGQLGVKYIYTYGLKNKDFVYEVYEVNVFEYFEFFLVLREIIYKKINIRYCISLKFRLFYQF